MTVFSKIFIIVVTFIFNITSVIASNTDGLSAAKSGDLVNINPSLIIEEIPALKIHNTVIEGPQLLLSNKPEYFFSGNGIAMQEIVRPGTIRLYIYHVPTPDNQFHTISAVIENIGVEELYFRFLKYSFQKPGNNYRKIGQNGLISFFDSKPDNNIRTISPGKTMVIDPTLDAFKVTNNQLVHGFYEFEINQPAIVTIFQRSTEKASTEIINYLEKLPREAPNIRSSGAGRGLFTSSNINVTAINLFDTKDGIHKIVVADGKSDPWVEGFDSISNKKSLNIGNYGVMYTIQFKWKSSNGQKLAILFTNGRSNDKKCKHAAGAIQIGNISKNLHTIALPPGSFTLNNLPQAAVIDTLSQENTEEIHTVNLTYSPPGGSCLPTPILLLPY